MTAEIKPAQFRIKLVFHLTRTLRFVVLVFDMSTIDLEVISVSAQYVYRPRQQHVSAQGNFALSALELGTRAVTILRLTSTVP